MFAALKQERQIEQRIGRVEICQVARTNRRQIHISKLHGLDHIDLAAQLTIGINVDRNFSIGELLDFFLKSQSAQMIRMRGCLYMPQSQRVGRAVSKGIIVRRLCS